MTTIFKKGWQSVAIETDFDGCQSIVKSLFSDLNFKDEVKLSAINSINWVRLIPQVVYYFYGAFKLGAPNKQVNFSVPTGNFGNIFAGWVAKKMGLPINTLICASNQNDILTRFFDSGVANADFQSSGNYEFANVIDIGAKHTARITASLTQTSDNPDDLFDNRSGNFDSASSNFDGDTPANCNAHIEIATSDDNTTYTDFRTFVIGEYTARYFKFRVVLISRDGASTPVVSEVTVTVDMQDRIFSGNDVVSGAGTKTVKFTNPFKSGNYAVGITGQGMATGDYFTVSNKTINGFDVAFFNSSNSGVSKTFDFICKGF